MELSSLKKYISEEELNKPHFQTRDLICRFKLVEIYQNLYLGMKNYQFSKFQGKYGDLVPKGELKEWLPQMFLQNTYLYYNVCIEFSWKMIYFYYKIENKNYTEKEIYGIEKNITYDDFLEFLNQQSENLTDEEEKDKQKVISLVNEFYKDEFIEKFREDCKYIKHRGAFDIFGLYNDETQLFAVEGGKCDIDIPKFKEFDRTENEKILYEFYTKFCDYIEKVIELTVNSL